MKKYFIARFDTENLGGWECPEQTVELTARDINQLIVNTRFTNKEYGRQDIELENKFKEVLDGK